MSLGEIDTYNLTFGKLQALFTDTQGYYESFLDANNIGIKDQRINMEKNIKQEIKESFEYALKSPEAEEADLFKYVYAD